MYDIWSPYDPSDQDTPESSDHLRRRLEQGREIVRAILPHLRRQIESPDREPESVSQILRPYYSEAGRDLPMQPEDLAQIESLCRRVLEVGGLSQNEIQEVLLRWVGATAAPRSVPFLLEMLNYSRRGDHFGPERRQLALWGLARIAVFHDVPEAYEALCRGLDDRRAEVRITAVDLILDAYLDRHGAHQEVPRHVVERLQQMAASDPDDAVRREAQKVLREPWAQEPLEKT